LNNITNNKLEYRRITNAAERALTVTGGVRQSAIPMALGAATCTAMMAM